MNLMQKCIEIVILSIYIGTFFSMIPDNSSVPFPNFPSIFLMQYHYISFTDSTDATSGSVSNKSQGVGLIYEVPGDKTTVSLGICLHKTVKSGELLYIYL